MHDKRAVALAWSSIITIIVLLLVAAVAIFFFLQGVGKGSIALYECSSLQNGLWIDGKCDPTISYESVMFSSIDNGEGGPRKHCCVPKPGMEEAYEEKYGPYRNSPENNPGGTGGTGGTGNAGRIYYIKINDETMLSMTNHVSYDEYDEGVSIKIISPNDELKIAGINSIESDIDNCSLSIRQAQYFELNGEQRIGQEKGDDGNLVPTDKLIEAEGEDCKEGLVFDKIQLTPPEASGDLLPFYKVDYVINPKEGESVSESTYISFLDEVNSLIVQNDLVIARDNVANCFVSAYLLVGEDEVEEPFTGTIKYKNQKIDYEDFTDANTERTFEIDYNSGKHWLKFIQPGASEVEKEYSFTKCDSVTYMLWDGYTQSYGECLAGSCDYSKSVCNDPNSRSTSCEKNIDDCRWKKGGGECLTCEEMQVSTCGQYNQKDTCDSNQCFEWVESRCYWQQTGIIEANGDCLECDYGSADGGDPCFEQYKKKKSCQNDACQFDQFSMLGVENCLWDANGLFGAGFCMSCYEDPLDNQYSLEEMCESSNDKCNYLGVTMTWSSGGKCFPCSGNINDCLSYSEDQCKAAGLSCGMCYWNDATSSCQESAAS